MRSLSKKIKDLRLSLGMRQYEFAEKVGGVDQSTISKWEKGIQKPAAHQVLEIAKLAKITPEQFLGVPSPRSAAGEAIPMRTVRVTGELQAGAWQDAADWPEDDQYEVPAPLASVWDDVPVHARVVTGSSMNRVYPDGAVVYIAPLKFLGRKPRSGDRVAVQRVDEAGNYETTLKEYVVGEGGKVWLWPRSDDPEFQQPIQYVDSKRRGNVTIVGVVIAHFVVEMQTPRED